MNAFRRRIKSIVDSDLFNSFIIIVILFSAVLVGFSVDLNHSSQYLQLVNSLEFIILIIFSIEIIMRILAEEKPLDFFLDAFNLFDFLIVAICFVPFQSKAVYILRLVRVFRTFRIFRAFPNLRPVMKGIVKSLSSVFFVAILLIVMIYIYAVLGVSLFGSVDPVHFGSLWKGLFTLFQILTLENWNTIMLPANAAYPLGGPLYFVSFIIIGTMIIMNLFLGIIIGNMSKAIEQATNNEDMKDYLDEDALREAQIDRRLKNIEKQLDTLIKKEKKRK
ncbi:MAG: Ion transport protein [archaeon ADurb.Bin336]|nr:MAG: Ion transport protein [archaeon ADurb.Bin336]